MAQLQNAIANGNTNTGGYILFKEPTALNVRGVNLFGGGQDPMQAREVTGALRAEFEAALAGEHGLSAARKKRLTTAYLTGGKVQPPLTEAEQKQIDKVREESEVRAALRARDYLRAEEMRRLLDIRRIVVTSVNNHPIRVADLVEGGPLESESGSAADSVTPVYDGQLGKKGVVVGHQTRWSPCLPPGDGEGLSRRG